MAQAPSTGRAEPRVSRNKRGGPSPTATGLFGTLVPNAAPGATTRSPDEARITEAEARAEKTRTIAMASVNEALANGVPPERAYRALDRTSTGAEARQREGLAIMAEQYEAQIAAEVEARLAARAQRDADTLAQDRIDVMTQFNRAAAPGQGASGINRPINTDRHVENIVPKRGSDAQSNYLYNGTRTYNTGGYPPERVREVLKNITGKDVSFTQLGDLVGAPAGSTVKVVGVNNTRVELRITNPLYDGTQDRTISYSRGEPHIHNDYWKMNDAAPEGTATHVFARGIDTAKKLGFGSVSVNAAGDAETSGNSPGMTPVRGTFVGYNSWARLGYNGPINGDDDIPDTIKFQGRTPRNLNELMSAPGGALWWRQHGTDFDGSFDLSDGSPQLQVLKSYLKEKKFKTGLSIQRNT